MTKVTLIALTLLVFGAIEVKAASTVPVLEVRVEGINHQAGEIGVAAFSSAAGFPIHLENSYEVQWKKLQAGQQTIDFVFDNLPPGDYAISVVHDTNGNRLVDRSTLGFPKEGVGFSNNQKVVLSSPSFKKCQFTLTAGERKKLSVQLGYPK